MPSPACFNDSLLAGGVWTWGRGLMIGQALCPEDGSGDLSLEWQASVTGIARLLWTEGKALIPCDFLTSPKAGRPSFKRCCGKLVLSMC